MRSSMFYDRILRETPAVNPPYLTGRGRVFFCAMAACFAGSGICYYLNMSDMAMFLSVLAAMEAFVLALVYTKCLLLWKGVENGRIRASLRGMREKLQLSGEVVPECVIVNDFLWSVHVEALRISHSKHVSVVQPADEPREVPGNGELAVAVPFKGCGAGRGRVYGLGVMLQDANCLFRSECHIELTDCIVVLPAWRIRSRSRDALVQAVQSRRPRQMSDEGEIDRVRPWQNGDSLRKINWRGYARRNELSVVEKQVSEELSAIFVIDAGPYMRVRRPDKSCNLCDCLVDMVRIAGEYGRISVVTYDESGAEIVARALSPKRGIQRYLDWLLKRLEWNPGCGPETAQAWSNAAFLLYRDFKLYHQVNFSKETDTGVKIDLKGLVNWATADMARRALADDDPVRASEILKKPYGETLMELIHSRCSMADETLPPRVTGAKLAEGTRLLSRLVRRERPDRVIWFSDFASELDAADLEKLRGILKNDVGGCIVRCARMPEHCLNFNVRDGERIRNINLVRIGPMAKVVDVEL